MQIRPPAEVTSRTHTTHLQLLRQRQALGASALLLAGKVESDRMATIWQPLAKQILGPSCLTKLKIDAFRRVFHSCNAIQRLQRPPSGVPPRKLPMLASCSSTCCASSAPAKSDMSAVASLDSPRGC